MVSILMKNRYPIEQIMPLAQFLAGALSGIGFPAVVCGSIRRQREMVGDIDMVVRGPIKVTIDIVEKFCNDFGRACNYLDLGNGSNKMEAIIDGVSCSFYSASHANMGAMVLYLTGSGLFNIALCGEAKAQGYTLSRYGLYHGEEVIAGKEEVQIFEALGVDYVPPKEREVPKDFNKYLKKER